MLLRSCPSLQMKQPKHASMQMRESCPAMDRTLLQLARSIERYLKRRSRHLWLITDYTDFPFLFLNPNLQSLNPEFFQRSPSKFPEVRRGCVAHLYRGSQSLGSAGSYSPDAAPAKCCRCRASCCQVRLALLRPPAKSMREEGPPGCCCCCSPSGWPRNDGSVELPL